MRRLAFLALLALSAPGFAENSTLFIRRTTAGGAGGGGGGGPFAFQRVGPGISSGTVTSASMTFTTDANTKMLTLAYGLRRNTGQNIQTCTWNGSEVFTDLNGTAGQMSAGIQFLRNPSVGTHNVVCTLTGSTAGFAMNVLAWSGISSDPVYESDGNAGSVTTSTVTQTAAVGNVFMSVLVKQDPSTSTPVLNTPSTQLVFSSTFSSSGSGGFFDIAATTAVTTSPSINYSWTPSANHVHTMMVVKP